MRVFEQELVDLKDDQVRTSIEPQWKVDINLIISTVYLITEFTATGASFLQKALDHTANIFWRDSDFNVRI